MSLYEVVHPDADRPHPQFNSWKDAIAAQKEWNKDCSGHKARKIPESEIPVDIICPDCKDVYTGFPHEKGSICIDCFSYRDS